MPLFPEICYTVETERAHPTREKYLEKTPLQTAQFDTPAFVSDDDSGHVAFTGVQVKEYMETRKNLNSAGTDDFPLLALMDLAKKNHGAELIAEFWNIIHLYAKELLDEVVLLNMTEVRAVCLAKKGNDFRPIGIGRALFRVVKV